MRNLQEEVKKNTISIQDEIETRNMGSVLPIIKPKIFESSLDQLLYFLIC